MPVAADTFGPGFVSTRSTSGRQTPAGTHGSSLPALQAVSLKSLNEPILGSSLHVGVLQSPATQSESVMQRELGLFAHRFHFVGLMVAVPVQFVADGGHTQLPVPCGQSSFARHGCT